ncbi:hypothetical protein MTQ00_09490 [Chryseobacterium sp. B21-037]|uniref:hypothetical protein n=1 Tax=Chryseobacterium sp. B21-037 TaxID=2926038 RepID=UPI00235954A9|nr:hypothetical protein [Chryseobacterium sp. B21-037]MDC8104773.1 hypothetical protein [Chryseobacterium sp. B21-037]
MVLQIFALCISISSLALAAFTYFKHDAKLKKQSALLNKFQLEKITKEKDDEKKAKVEANILQKSKGARVIKVYNKGKSTAKNVTIHFPNLVGLQVVTNPFPLDIKPQNSYEIVLFLTIDAPDTTKIEFEWQDDFAEKNLEYQILQF